MPPTPTTKTTDGGNGNGTEYRYMGNYATELSVGDALVWLSPGEFVTLSDSEAGKSNTREMIDAGILVDVSTIGATPDEPAAQTTDDSTKGGK